MSPVFSASEANYNFKTSTVLPFSELTTNIKGGAFSTVHKVAIYEGYYKDADVPVSGFLLISHTAEDDTNTRARVENRVAKVFCCERDPAP
jgi:hypothetical protein